MNITLPPNHVSIAETTPGVPDWKARAIAHELDGLTGEALGRKVNNLSAKVDPSYAKVVRHIFAAGTEGTAAPAPANKKASVPQTT